MAIIRVKEIRKLEDKDRQKRVGELKFEFAKEKANIAIGANVTSPGRLREIRKTIARIKTIQNEKGGLGK
jgi:large subunit ribosomal protein L29